MSDSEIARYSRRFVQYFWDPAPRNDDAEGSPIFFLGSSYDSQIPPSTPMKAVEAVEGSAGAEDPVKHGGSESHSQETHGSQAGSEWSEVEDTHGENKSDDGGGWPAPFLDDFESRAWFTYRNNFPPIPKSHDPKASSAMTFSVRLRSHLGNQEGFTSDTGWACMIRSGQSLLANSLLLCELGRGRLYAGTSSVDMRTNTRGRLETRQQADGTSANHFIVCR